MISRVIEAKPEELRVFLEEAAGVSKYRERRRETELRLNDTRENLLRVDDIRQELDKQLEHLRGAGRGRRRATTSCRASSTTTQSLLWLTAQAGSRGAARPARARDRAARASSSKPRPRGCAKRSGSSRSCAREHYRASDEVHAAQGAFYEANAETSRGSSRRSRTARQPAARRARDRRAERAARARPASSSAAAEASLAQWRDELAPRGGAAGRARGRAAGRSAKSCRWRRKRFARARNRHDELQRAARADRAGAAGRAHQARARAAAARPARAARASGCARSAARCRRRMPRGSRALREEIAAARGDALRAMRGELDAREDELPQRRAGAARAQRRRWRPRRSAWPGWRRALHTLGAAAGAARARRRHGGLARAAGTRRRAAPVAGHPHRAGLGGRAGSGAARAAERHRARRGWTQAQRWFGDAPPGKTTFYAPGQEAPRCSAALVRVRAAAPLRRVPGPGLAAVVAEWLHQRIRRAATPRRAWPQREPAARGRAAGDARRARLHAPQRELPRARHRAARRADAPARDRGADGARSRRRATELERPAAGGAGRGGRHRAAARRARCSCASASTTSSSASTPCSWRRCGFRAERARRPARASRSAAELAEIEAQAADAAGAQRESAAQRDRAPGGGAAARARASSTLAADLYQRAETRAGSCSARPCRQRATQPSRRRFIKQSCDNKINEIEIINSSHCLRALRALAPGACRRARRSWPATTKQPLQERLQQALALRKEREAALARAARRAGGHGGAAEGDRPGAGRVRAEARAAARAHQRDAAEGAGGAAHRGAVRAAARRGRRARGRARRACWRRARGPAPCRPRSRGSPRRSGSSGAVNLAALEELRTAQERKDYLDAQSRDLTEAIATLEDAIRRIDRETRERLQRTFDEVNDHFGQMFPALFGGGHARLVLTGRGDPRRGRAGDRPAAGQEEHHDPPALGRREGADRARAGVLAVPAESRRRSACWTRSTRRSTTTTPSASASS